MESNYYDQEINGISFTGELDLGGPNGLGGGGGLWFKSTQ